MFSFGEKGIEVGMGGTATLEEVGEKRGYMGSRFPSWVYRTRFAFLGWPERAKQLRSCMCGG